jgi:hypothetical protein
MKVTKFAFEAQLLRWTESSNGGATVVLQLSDADDLTIFKTMTLAKRGVVGQRLAVAVAEIGDDEQLVPHETKDTLLAPTNRVEAETAAIINAGTVVHYVPTEEEGMAKAHELATAAEEGVKQKASFPGGFCGLSVKWCDDPYFRDWLVYTFSEAWDRSSKYVRLANKTANVERAVWVIKEVCEVTSRKELDSDKNAHARFDILIRDPYMKALRD